MNYLQQVKDHAAAQGMTPKELCAAAGVHEDTWRRWRKGRFRPQIRTLERLLAVRNEKTDPPARRRGIA